MGSATGWRRSRWTSSEGRCSRPRHRSLQPRPSSSRRTHSGPGTPWTRPIDAFHTGFVEFHSILRLMRQDPICLFR
jgi:hypothetical protein